MDASQGQVLLAVLKDDTTVNLYISDECGTSYSLSLRNIVTNNFQWNSGVESFDFYIVSTVLNCMIVCTYVFMHHNMRRVLQASKYVLQHINYL